MVVVVVVNKIVDKSVHSAQVICLNLYKTCLNIGIVQGHGFISVSIRNSTLMCNLVESDWNLKISLTSASQGTQRAVQEHIYLFTSVLENLIQKYLFPNFFKLDSIIELGEVLRSSN